MGEGVEDPVAIVAAPVLGLHLHLEHLALHAPIQYHCSCNSPSVPTYQHYTAIL
jgi:hypothetical protein